MASDDYKPTRKLPNDIICKVCSRLLATTSSNGDLVPTSTRDQACDTCRAFHELHENVKTKDAAFTEVEGRRTEHGGRQLALEDARAAHKALDNFLIQVEQSTQNTTNRQPSPPQQVLPSPVAHDQHGQKRNLTPSPLPKAKRPRLEADKRTVSFDASVVFRDEFDGRPYQVFNRASEEYVPGRNAPADPGGFLDTSGYGVAPGRFFGVRKHKKGWIETKEGREMDESWWGGDDAVTGEHEADDKGKEGIDNGNEAVELSGHGHAGSSSVAESRTVVTQDGGLGKTDQPHRDSLRGQASSLFRAQEQPRSEACPQSQAELISSIPTTAALDNIDPQSSTERSLNQENSEEQELDPESNETVSLSSPSSTAPLTSGHGESLPQHLKCEVKDRG